MHTECLAALGTGPPFHFVSDEMSYTAVLYHLKIVNHAHTIFGPVALIQALQAGTRIAGTTEAILDRTIHQIHAILDSALDAGFRFMRVVTLATGTMILTPDVGIAEATVHSARGDQGRGNHKCLCRSLPRHFSNPVETCAMNVYYTIKRGTIARAPFFMHLHMFDKAKVIRSALAEALPSPRFPRPFVPIRWP